MIAEKEVWKDVVGYEHIFQVSNFGNVFSKRSNKKLKQQLHENGYLIFATKIEGKNKCFKVHRLVAEAFLDKPEEVLLKLAHKTKYGLVIVNHKDGNKQNNHVSNLEWSSHSLNTKHALEQNLIKPLKGSSNGNSKFNSEEERYSVYLKFIESGLSYRKFALEINVSHSLVSRLVRDFKNVVQ